MVILIITVIVFGVKGLNLPEAPIPNFKIHYNILTINVRVVSRDPAELEFH